MLKKYKYFTALVLTSFTSTVMAWCCLLYQNTAVMPSFILGNQAIQRSIDGVDIMVSRLIDFQSERLKHAIAVLTKQKSYASNQIQNAHLLASKNKAEAFKLLEQAERVKQARLNYGPDFGQGYNPCTISSERKFMQKQMDDASQDAIKFVSNEITASPGNYANKDKFIEHTLSNYQEKYCTPAQVEQGLCKKVGSLAGESINFTSLFKASEGRDKTNPQNKPLAPQYQAKIDFIEQLAGTPDEPIPEEAKNTANGRIYMQFKQQKDALVSPALYTFKNIQNEHIESQGAGSSIADMFNKESNRYMGVGSDGKAWSNTIAQQTQRGLLIELMKIKALDLTIQGKQFEQQERIESSLAVLVANAAQKMTETHNVQNNALSKK
jgi:hypothetical protein